MGYDAVNFQYLTKDNRNQLFNKKQFDIMRTWGINGCRFGFNENTVNLADFDQAVQWSIIDNNIALSFRFRAGIPGQSRPSLPCGSYVESAWLNAWTTLAQRYNGLYYDKMFFDLYCEPHTNGATLEAWRSCFQNCVNEIHAIDPNRICIVETLNGWQGGWGQLNACLDAPITGGNVWYSVHIYRHVVPGPVGMGWGNYGTSKEEVRKWLREYCRMYEALDRGYTVVVQETGVRSDYLNEDSQWWLNFLEVLKELNVGYAAWSWDVPEWGTWRLIKDLKGTPSPQGKILQQAIGGVVPPPTKGFLKLHAYV